MVEVLGGLGFLVNYTKSQIEPSQEIEFLGFRIPRGRSDRCLRSAVEEYPGICTSPMVSHPVSPQEGTGNSGPDHTIRNSMQLLSSLSHSLIVFQRISLNQPVTMQVCSLVLPYQILGYLLFLRGLIVKTAEGIILRPVSLVDDVLC